MVSGERVIIVKMNDLHYRTLEIRDHLFKGDKLLLTSRGRPVALIKPLTEKSRTPADAVVRSISYVDRHRREFAMELAEGTRIIFTYKGKKIALVDPDIPRRLAGARF
ncbi:MAG: hypothetical protein JW854_09320 [Actinobacteria bacterium]|nr:hypothetical protein [Actinomycetota bacterium]